MTHDDEKRFDIFEEKLRLLIEQHTALKAENEALKKRLVDAGEALAMSNSENELLQESYRNLKAGRVLEGIDPIDVDGTRERLARLVREVDQCIALINA